MILKPNARIYSFLVALSAACFFYTAQAEIILIQENFGGDGTGNLNGTNADTFLPAITTAGGNDTWSGRTSFKNNGDLVAGGLLDGTIALSLGSYINAAKNTATGLFTLNVTMTQPVGGTWVSVGFLTGNNSNANFVFNNGLGTSLHRTNDTGTNYFRGPGTSVAGIDPGVLTGTVTFTTVLDLRPEGGYNGTTNFGTVHFSNSLGVGGVQSATFDANQDFNHVGFSYTGADLVANLSQFQVTQIPEPSSLILMGVALLAVVGLRSRKP